jgi:hypothetical protein
MILSECAQLRLTAGCGSEQAGLIGGARALSRLCYALSYVLKPRKSLASGASFSILEASP